MPEQVVFMIKIYRSPFWFNSMPSHKYKTIISVALPAAFLLTHTCKIFLVNDIF